MSAVMPTYGRLPLEACKGEGAWLFDEQGNAYLDTFTGIAVCSLGHANPEIADVVASQARTLVHCSNFFHINSQEQLAEKLCQISGMDNVFFGNSGAEANECAIKIARMFASHKGISQPKIITTEHSFHGRTLATLSATGNPKVQKGFEPLVSGFVQVPYNDIAAVERLSNDPDIVAIMIEPVQGEGGVNVPADDYLNSIRALCDQNDWLLIADEIQTGIARTGQWFAYQHADITPDVVTSAKALGNGVPIGACLTHGKAAKLLQAGNHGSTYGGNPLSTSVAKKVLEIIERDGLVKQAEIQGAKLLQSLKARLLAHEKIKDIRGLGMMVGIELDQDCADLMKRGIDRGVLVNVTQGHVVRLLPALNMSDSQLDDLIDKICSLIEDYLAE